MKPVHIQPSKNEDLFTVYIEFENVSAVHSVMKYTRNLPADCRILLYVPACLSSLHRDLESKAFQLRQSKPPKKTSIRWSNNTFVLHIRDSNNRWIPCDVQHSPFHSLSTTTPCPQPPSNLNIVHQSPPNLNMLHQRLPPVQDTVIQHNENINSTRIIPTANSYQHAIQYPPIHVSAVTSNAVHPPLVHPSFNNWNPPPPPTLTTLTPVQPMPVPQHSTSNPPASPEHNTDGNIYSQQRSTANMIQYWNLREQIENQGNI